MAATVLIYEWNGTTGAQSFTSKGTSGGTIRFKKADAAAVDLANPLVIPSTAGGIEHSYEKWIRLRMTVGPASQVDNLRFYTDGVNGYGAGVSLWAAAATTAYVTPVIPPTSVNPHWGGSTGNVMADAFGYVSTASLALSTGVYSTTGDIGKHNPLVMRLTTAASPGVLTAELGTYAYDEI